ncbi:MAG: phosphate butyryltransferase [Bacteroidetes bacterium HGW-Bacteroidetes-4]|jgi:phosphate butyryltransferase|nr:MAG: phosphate butyryltransferase [Bacteroidetes bacterium HGW-Bacteroidetes-4]
MNITKLEQMYDVLRGAEKKKLVAVWANDSHTIEAVSEAIDLGIVEGTLVGDIVEIEKVCKNLSIDSSKFKIVDCKSDNQAGDLAVKLVIDGEGDILMKGLLSTDKYMRAILNKEAGLLPPKAVLSHVTVIENVHYHKLLVVGDVAIIPEPDLKQKIAIANYLIQTAKALGMEKPKLSLISASEQVLPTVQSSVDACIISKMGDRGQIKGAIIDGPLSLDASIDAETAKTKGITSPVAGDADCLLFPNLDAGNVFYKMNSKMSEAEMGAFVAGAKVPCVLSSRGDTTKTKLNSIALCAMLALSK